MTAPAYHYVATLQAIAAADPDRVLLASPTTTSTAAEFLARVTRIAKALQDNGLQVGDPIALMSHNRPEVIECLYAGFLGGTPPANVNPRYRPSEIAYVVNDSGARVLVFDPTVSAVVHDAAASFDHPVELVEFDSPHWAAIVAAEPTYARELDAADQLFIYTGGTTGAPRAVVWEVPEHYQMNWGMVRHDVPPPQPAALLSSGRKAPTALPCSPILHGVGLSLTLNTLNGGGTVVVAGEPSFSAAHVLGLVERYDVAVLGIVGDAFAAPILRELETGNWTGRLGSLKAISSAGAAWGAEMRADLHTLLPNTRMISNFGSTEALVTRDMENAEPFVPERPVVILGSDGQPVPAGEVGQLATSGHLPVGYLNAPEKSALTFPVLDGVRYALTGDEARVEPDGRIRILGRGTSVINTGGEKVWPEEVEAVLQGHPDVLDAVVLGRPDERWGQRVTAVVQLRADTELSDAALVARCRETLAGYKCPKEWIRLPQIPRTTFGKPDYPGIRALLDAP